jgi:hypothetical protein
MANAIMEEVIVRSTGMTYSPACSAETRKWFGRSLLSNILVLRAYGEYNTAAISKFFGKY